VPVAHAIRGGGGGEEPPSGSGCQLSIFISYEGNNCTMYFFLPDASITNTI
jgi:hypothetical protein